MCCPVRNHCGSCRPPCMTRRQTRTQLCKRMRNQPRVLLCQHMWPLYPHFLRSLPPRSRPCRCNSRRKNGNFRKNMCRCMLLCPHQARLDTWLPSLVPRTVLLHSPCSCTHFDQCTAQVDSFWLYTFQPRKFGRRDPFAHSRRRLDIGP